MLTKQGAHLAPRKLPSPILTPSGRAGLCYQTKEASRGGRSSEDNLRIRVTLRRRKESRNRHFCAISI